jgi:succinate-semialdehyde dehydrogenase/glutarate-semialdehyde dehydrogenase
LPLSSFRRSFPSFSTAFLFAITLLPLGCSPALLFLHHHISLLSLIRSVLTSSAKVFDAFAEKLASAVKQFRVGNGMESGTTHGPLIHDRAVTKVKAHVDDAVSKGANVLVGGKPLKGSFFEPTVLTGVSPDAAVMHEETFGPLAALVSFDSEEEVVELANDTEHGLAGYFYSRDIGRVWRVAEALETGMVGVNTGIISQTACPFGGIKER